MNITTYSLFLYKYDVILIFQYIRWERRSGSLLGVDQNYSLIAQTRGKKTNLKSHFIFHAKTPIQHTSAY